MASVVSRRIPEAYAGWYIGRVLERRDDHGDVQTGIGLHAVFKAGYPDPARAAAHGIAIQGRWLVRWDGGQEEVLEEEELALVATDQFDTDAKFLEPRYRALVLVRPPTRPGSPLP